MRRVRVASEFSGIPPESIRALPRREGYLRAVVATEPSEGELDELSSFAVSDKLLLTLERNRAEPIRGERRGECPCSVHA